MIGRLHDPTDFIAEEFKNQNQLEHLNQNFKHTDDDQWDDDISELTKKYNVALDKNPSTEDDMRTVYFCNAWTREILTNPKYHEMPEKQDIEL